jgi:hypothetical protein
VETRRSVVELIVKRNEAEMIFNRSLACSSLLFLMAFFSCSRIVSARQSSGCSASDLEGVLKADDSAYADAMELAKTLREAGFTVKCVLQSKSVSLFEGQKGAALYRTNRGDFEALFLPKGHTFALRTAERRESGRYVYTFEGSPRFSERAWDSVRATYFAPHGNQLFITSERRLVEELDAAFHSP